MTSHHVIVVGAGAGGLAAAADLARLGHRVTLLERAATVGGKMRQLAPGGVPMDAGPTVFTMRWVFEALFADAGASLEGALRLHRADVLARHAWPDGSRLDLFADQQQTADAIAAFAGPSDAAGFRAFAARASAMYGTLARPFMESQRPNLATLGWRVGSLQALWRISPLHSLWGALGRHFRDPRLRQLYARYATYVGSSPFRAPATLMLIAHVESQGVWLVDGGMHALARAMAALAEGQGVHLRTGTPVARLLVDGGRAAGVELADGERLGADAIVFNGDVGALATGLMGAEMQGSAAAPTRRQRSLSALVWAMTAEAEGFPLHHHNVFFGADYAAEFDALFRQRRVAPGATAYLCAQDRGLALAPANSPERLLLLLNAPADGDGAHAAQPAEERLAETLAMMQAAGLRLTPGPMQLTGPDGFAALFPGGGGALYGRASHGPFASFQRPGARARLPGLYLAGGSVHPGAGVPMAVLSGRLAAEAVALDLARHRR